MTSRQVLLSLPVILFVAVRAFAEQPQIEVIAKSARVKIRDETIATVNKGEKYRLLKTDGAWTAIVIGEGDNQKRGWVLSSAVRPLVDPAVSEDSPAPEEPVEVRLSVDLVQFPLYGPQSSMIMKIGIANESGAPLDFKVQDLKLKVDDQALPLSERNPNFYYPVYTEASMAAQSAPASLSFLKDAHLAHGAAIEGWLEFSLAAFQQEIYQPGTLGNRKWIIEGKVGPHKIHFDLKEHEQRVLGGKVRPSAVEPSVQVIEVGPRLNILSLGKLLEGLRSIPADEKGCVIVLTKSVCLFDNLATQQFQQQQFQVFQMGPEGNAPVVSLEGPTQNQFGYRGYFSYGQLTLVPSESAGALTILGRRPNSGEALVKHLQSKDAAVRAAAAQALLRHLPETGVIKALTAAADDADAPVRVAALAALGGAPPAPGMRQNDSIDTAAVVKAMADADASVRMTAAQTAQNFPCDRARVVLIKLLDDTDLGVKVAAANSLGAVKARDSVARLKELQNDNDSQLKTAVVDALKNIGELTPVAAALAKLDGGNLYDHDYAELGKAKEKRAVPGLVARLRDPNNPYQTNLAAKALGEIGDTAAVEPLIQAFLYGNRNFGMSDVPRTLGKLGDKRAIEPLREMVKGNPQQMQWDLRSAIFEGLLMLKAPGIFEETTTELKRLSQSGQFYAISPLLSGLGHTGDEKAIAVLTPWLANQQTAAAAIEGLLQIGTKEALAAIEKQLTAPNFPNAQFVIGQRQWTRTPAQIGLLKRLAASRNSNVEAAATSVLATLQGPAPPAGPPSPIGYYAPRIEADAWVNGEVPKPGEVAGKVVVIALVAPAGGAIPDLPRQLGAWQQKFGKQDLVVMALWNQSGWDWNAADKALVARPEATLKQEQAALAALAKARGIAYRVGLVAPARGLIEQFGGAPGARFAIVDRSGILQAVQAAEDDESKPVDLEPLLAELLAEPSPSAAMLNTAEQAAGQKVPPLSFDAAATCWTIPAHEGTVWSVRFSPVSGLLATTSEDGTAKLWDTRTGQLRHTLRGHNGIVRSSAFTHDGRQFLTSGFDRTIRVWDPESGAAVRTFADDAPVYSLSLLGDDRTVISSSSDARVRYWNLAQGMIEGYFLGHSATAWVSAAATIDGKSTIISGSTDKTAKIWDFQTGVIRRTLSGHSVGLTAVAISSDAKTVASGAGDGEVIIWDAGAGQADHTIPASGAVVYDLSFSPDKQSLAVARGNHTVTLYEVATGKPTKEYNRGGWCVQVSADGRLLASGSDDRTVRIWRVGK